MKKSSMLTVIGAVFGRAMTLTGLVIASLLAVSIAAHAQNATGNIRGYVRTQDGAPAPSVQVTARETSMGTTRGTATNADGFYSLMGLRPGSYELTVRRIGFAAQTRTAVVQIGATNLQDFSLTANATQLASVVVTAASSV